MVATLAQKGDADSELRFNIFPDEEDPSTWEGHVTAVIPKDFEHNLLDDNTEIEVHSFTITDDSFSISATFPLVELSAGDEHLGTLEASC